MVLWFIIKQTQTEMIMTILHADSPTVLLENGSMVHNQTNADINIRYHDTKEIDPHTVCQKATMRNELFQNR